jgi:periplasmic divalent cation tolerance protein
VIKRARWKPPATGVKVEFTRNFPVSSSRRLLREADFGSNLMMLMLAWTTVAIREDADRLADAAIAAGLAVCVQIEGPITSVYRWDSKIEHNQEFRLVFKCLSARASALESQILALHPYMTPEWIVLEASHVSEKYLSWARINPQS